MLSRDGAVILAHRCILADEKRVRIVEYRRFLIVTQRKEPVNSAEGNATAQLLAVLLQALAHFRCVSAAELFRKRFDTPAQLLRGSKKHLGCRRNSYAFYGLSPALGLKVEIGQAVDGISP